VKIRFNGKEREEKEIGSKSVQKEYSLSQKGTKEETLIPAGYGVGKCW
jgi:hypothetical protein